MQVIWKTLRSTEDMNWPKISLRLSSLQPNNKRTSRVNRTLETGFISRLLSSSTITLYRGGGLLLNETAKLIGADGIISAYSWRCEYKHKNPL